MEVDERETSQMELEGEERLSDEGEDEDDSKEDESEEEEEDQEEESKGGWKEDDSHQKELRKKMIEIQSDPTLDAQQKTKKIQELVMQSSHFKEEIQTPEKEQKEENVVHDEKDGKVQVPKTGRSSAHSSEEMNSRTIKVRTLNSQLSCKLCGGYFKDAHTIKECLHSFCKSCIFKYFSVNSDCPTCHASLGTNPLDGIKLDRQLQNIVDKILPELDAIDNEMEKQFYKERGLEVPHSPEDSKKRTTETDNGASADVKKMKKSDTMKKWYTDEVSFELTLDENEPTDILKKLDKPFIRTSAKVTVIHLKKYLKKKLELANVSDVEILYRGGVLGNEHSLEYIFKSRGVDPEVENGTKPPHFIYRIRRMGQGLIHEANTS